MTKPLSTKDIQLVSLEILKVVHSFCISNGIRYSLAYGTLIGAVRHKGFIPWDDDIDIIMPRPDYNSFCQSFQAEGYSLISEFNPDCYINYCKVFETEKTICKTLAPFCSQPTGGVNIDIFPIDSVSDDFDSFVTDVKDLYLRWRRQIRYRSSMASLPEIFHSFQAIDVMIFLAIKFSFLGKFLVKRENKRIRRINNKREWGATGHWSQMVFMDDGYRNYQSIDYFDELIDLPFEGYNFRVMAGYEFFLKSLYGDYMALPPEEKRIPKHKQTTYFWKS